MLVVYLAIELYMVFFEFGRGPDNETRNVEFLSQELFPLTLLLIIIGYLKIATIGKKLIFLPLIFLIVFLYTILRVNFIGIY